jgi:deazaflavin-dependent oxidoreductase (nitroreductase family)
MVSHVGRKSGRLYVIPTEGRVCGDWVVIPLAFGTGADWCRNIRAAGRGRIRWRGKEYEMISPEVRPYKSIQPLLRDGFPAWERVTFRIMGFTEFLVLNAGKPA